MLGPAWTCSDAFGYVRIRLDAFGCIRTHSKSFGNFTSSDSFNFEVKGDLNKLYFLSPYLPELDSINGNIGMNLELEGSINNLIRNGSISINNGTAHTLFLNDPITDINMIAEMTNNKLIIGNLVGNIYRKNEKKLDFNTASLTSIPLGGLL